MKQGPESNYSTGGASWQMMTENGDREINKNVHRIAKPKKCAEKKNAYFLSLFVWLFFFLFSTFRHYYHSSVVVVVVVQFLMMTKRWLIKTLRGNQFVVNYDRRSLTSARPYLSNL